MSATISVEDSQAFSDETNSQKIESIFNEVKNRLVQKQHRPDSTYRIQFNREFTFKQAYEQIPYLKQLGISDLYASPYFRARAESMHGYDIAAHNELNSSIGTEEDYNAMVEQLHRHGMAQILDTVPNHMGIGETSNAWWMDVLENGPSSLYAPFFDIDWHPLKDELTNKVLLPVLGEMYGRVLENKELQLKFTPENGTFQLYYYDHCFPVNPRSYQYILEYRHDELLETLGAESDAALEYESILTALRNLPRRDETERERMVERAREKEIIKRRIAALCQQEHRFQQFIEQNIETFNGVKGEPRSFDRLAELLENQSYRLSYWRVAAEEINYRRFFDVNELAAIRVDQPEVFEESHRLIFRLLREGKINGVRTDHIDGLRNPRAYLQNLQRAYFLEICRMRLDELHVEGETRKDLEVALLQRYEDEVNGNPDSTLARSLYVVVEKILGRGESLPTNWPTYGTTGYEFTNLVNALFVDGANEKTFDQIYSGFIGEKIKFADLAYQKKKQIMWVSLASEINVLTNQLNRISESDRFYRDLTLNSLRNGIREVIACFPVYRTYITRRHETPDKADQQHIETAVNRAKKRNPTLDPTVFDFIRDVLLLKYPEYLSEEEITARYNFVMKFQQTTSPIMAKGLEDTAFYIYNRLISLNEVGGEPDQFGITLANFHRQQAERQNRWPYSLLTTSTHDTKRSEDVRARINVLSEWPKEWKAALTRWSRFNRKKKTTLEGSPAPGPNEEYFLYQTLLGVWPFNHDPQNREAHEELVERVKQYMCKAMKEAKVATSWVNPNQPYEEAVLNFVTAILDPNDPKNKFLPDFVSFQKKVAHYGAFNALSQTLLKLTSPGVPDIYQGNETWDFSLVDPDNRRPVDYALRQRMLSEVEQIGDAAGAASLVENKEDGRIKLYISSKTLKYRQEHRSLFETGTYTPLEVRGPRQDNVCAFARNYQDQALVVVAPRLLTRLAAKAGEIGQVTGSTWADSSLVLPVALGGIKRFRNIFTGEVLEAVTQDGKPILPLDQIFGSFPVAMLEKIEE